MNNEIEQGIMEQVLINEKLRSLAQSLQTMDNIRNVSLTNTINF